MTMTIKNICLSAFILLLSGCNYLDIEPIGQVIPHSKADYRALLTTAYANYPSHKQKLQWPSDEVAELAKDYGAVTSTLLNITWQPNDIEAQEYSYIELYTAIFYANEVIDKVMNSEEDASGEDRNQIYAEAHAMRAYLYFDLVNSYAKWYDKSTAATDKGVPVTTEIDIKQEFPRASVEQTYDQILSDIETAKSNMKVEHQTEGYKYRFSKLSLLSLESRVRLYRGEWDAAHTLASEALTMAQANGLALVDLVNLADGTPMPYSSKSTEAILSLERVFPSLILELDNTYLSESIISLFSQGDSRLTKYIKKTELMTPDFMLFRDAYRSTKEKQRVSIRLAELYLNAAEAALKMSTPSVERAKSLLAELQTKRYTTEALPNLDAMNNDQLLTEIYNERGRELLMEGHRWFDLRRTTRPKINKTIITEWYFDSETFQEVKKTETYTLNANDVRYILPFPRSAKEENEYLN